MEYAIEAFKEAIDLVGLNSRIPLASFAIFLTLTIVIRKTTETGRRKLGNVMLGFSVPSILMALADLILFILTFIRGYHNLKASNGFSVFEDESRILYTYNGTSVTLILVDLFIIFIMGIAAFVIGIIILKKECGKAVGISSIIIGLTFAIFSIFKHFCFKGI